MIMVRLESMLSCMCTPERDVERGVNKNVSKPSKSEWKAWYFPPGSKLGRALSNNLFKAFIYLYVVKTVGGCWRR